ncbi:hypothetical protein C5167_002486 [Papaver somniferum]|uniref:Uncharacterized protein n=1 Tax=Papaver somniferum TaxID=3469 RepID=A0A4Y7L117_PAPSO|nr:hypothetical protein C5167_002486 [Papaver somniferum]
MPKTNIEKISSSSYISSSSRSGLEIFHKRLKRSSGGLYLGRPRGDKLLVICTVMSTLFIWRGLVSLYWSLLAACVEVELGSLKGRHPLMEDVKKKAVALGHVNFSTPPNDENYEVLIDENTDSNMELYVLEMENLDILIPVRRLNGQSNT